MSALDLLYGFAVADTDRRRREREAVAFPKMADSAIKRGIAEAWRRGDLMGEKP